MFTLESFLNPFFEMLESHNISYCVLRGYESLPVSTRYDIDIAISEKDLPAAESVVKNASKISGWKVVSRMVNPGFCRLVLYHPDYPQITLPIDFISKHTVWGLCYADNATVINERIKHNSMYIARWGFDAAVNIVGKLTRGKGSEIRSEALNRIQRLTKKDPEGFEKILEKNISKDLVLELSQAIQLGTWNTVFELSSKIRKSLISHNGLMRSYQGAIETILQAGVRRLKRRGGMEIQGGMFVVLLGPDGSGKSTIAKEIDQFLKPLFLKSAYYHGRFHIFPQLGKLKQLLPMINRQRQTELNLGPVTSYSIRDRPPLNSFRAIANIIYYGTEFIFGRFITWLKLRCNTLIICDRYFYDYLLYPEYIKAPIWLIKIFSKLIPQPDIILLLRCDPQTIWDRKQEISITEIDRQQRILDVFEKSLKNSVIIETNTTIAETVSNATEIILNRFISAS